MTAAEGDALKGFTAYDVGPLWQRPRSSLWTRVAQTALGPNCTGGVWVDYRKVDVRPPRSNGCMWLRIKGYNPGEESSEGLSSARPYLPRNRQYAACLAFNDLLFEELAEYGYDVEALRPAMARVTRNGDVVAGPMPPSANFGTYKPFEQPDEDKQTVLRTVLYRTGPSMVTEVAMPALLGAAEGQLIVPRDVRVLYEGIPINQPSYWRDEILSPIV